MNYISNYLLLSTFFFLTFLSLFFAIDNAKNSSYTAEIDYNGTFPYSIVLGMPTKYFQINKSSYLPNIIKNNTIPMNVHNINVQNYAHNVDNTKSLKTFITQTFIEDYVFVEMSFVGVTTESLIYFNNTFYATQFRCQSHVPDIKKLVGMYDYIMAAGLSSSYTYGHWVLDIIAPLSLIPVELRQKFHIFLKKQESFHSEIAEIVGINKEHIHELNMSEFVVGKHVYQFNPICCNSYHLKAYIELRKIMFNYFKLNERSLQYKADKYVLFNRHKGSRREILNIDFVLEQLSISCPANWVICYPLDTVKETALFFNSIKFAIGASGSENTNALFMQNNNVYCEITTSLEFPWVVYHMAASNVHYFVYRDQTIPHFAKNDTLNLNFIDILARAGKDKLIELNKYP